MKALRLAIAALVTIVPFAPAWTANEVRMTCSTSKCHADIGRGEIVHGPVKSKGCQICHEALEPGAQPHPKLKTLSVTETNNRCVVCHETYPAKLKAFKTVHGAIEKKSCVGCHNPHQSSHKYLLKKDPSAALCLDCHRDVADRQAGGTHHKIAEMKNGCLNCHAPHGSANAKLLTAEQPATLCLNCHKDAQKSSDGTTIASIKSWLEDTPVKHEPVAKGQCVKCHQVHGSDKSKLLNKQYTEKVYQPFAEAETALCFECHKPTLATSRKAESETAFRNGGTNLHYLHLMGQKKQRSCRTCHEVHGSHQERLVRSSFMYKSYELPIQYRKTENGGSCTTACHKEMRYDRTRVIENEKNRY